MGSDCGGGARIGRRTGVRPAVRGRVLATLLALALVTPVAGCGVGPFASGGSDTTAPTGEPSAATSVAPESSPPPTPLLDSTLDPNTTVGALAPGFPVDLLPVPEGAEVLVSSVEPVPSSDAYQVSLNLRSTLGAADIVSTYRTSLTAAGFAEVAAGAPDAALAAQSTFTRSGGDELLVIGVLDRDDVRTVTIGGRLRGEG